MKLAGPLDVRFRLKRIIGRVVSNHVFRSQIYRKEREINHHFGFHTYFSAPEFVLLIRRAAHLIGKDQLAAEIVREFVAAVVEIADEVNLSRYSRSGMLIGAYYDVLPRQSDSEIAEISVACALVQFAVARKLLLRLGERFPHRHDMRTEKRIKRISIKAMHAFTVRAQLGDRYSYEIECKLKNGAFEC